jgi:excisionase family DNA binding protein
MTHPSKTPLDAMSAADVAEALGLARETVVEMARRGELPRVKLNRRVIVFRRSSIEALLKRREAPALR